MDERQARRALAWREAAVFGALWGALEVTFGSFLHILRVPLSGLILTLAAVILLVAGRRLFDRPGFALRAALVCAALKSFSPGGIIVGPMIAIVMEGVLIGLAFLLLRAPTLAALAGGASATLWTILQMLLTRLLLYGLSIFELYLALLAKAAQALSLPKDVGWPALGALLLILILSGGTAGLLGLRLARRLNLKGEPEAARGASSAAEVRRPEPQPVPASDFRLVALLAAGIIAAQIPGRLPWTAFGLALALLGARWLDVGALRFLGRARFWIASLIIGAGAGLLLGKAPIYAWGIPLSLQGLSMGAQMVLRSAALLITLALLARHMPRARFLALSDRLGLAPLGPSVGVAMDLLPALIDGWREAAQRGRRDPRGLFMAVGGLISEAARLAQPPTPVFFITGAPGTGKTWLLKGLIEEAEAAGWTARGVLQPRRPVEGSRDHYDLVDLRDGVRRPLVGFEAGRAVFQEAEFTRAAEAISASEGLVIVDELGHLEARGGGHWPSVEARVSRGGAVFVFAVARRRVEAFKARLPTPRAVIDLDEAEAHPARFKAQILKALSALLLLLAVAPSLARAKEEEAEAPVIVLGHREARKSASTTLYREDMEGAADVAQALEGAPGVEIDAAPKSTHLRLRGFDSRAILLLIDGVPVDEVYSGELDLSSLAAAPIERIEIDRGLTSVLYGPNALGGVINLYTRAPKRRLEGEVEIEAGQYHDGAPLQRAARGRLGGRVGPLSMGIGGALWRSDGFRLSEDFRTTAQNADFHEDGGVRDNSDARRYSLNAHALYKPLPGLKISAAAHSFNQARGIPTMESAGYTRIWRFVDYETRLFSLSARYHPEARAAWAFQGVEAQGWLSDHEDHLVDCEDLSCARLTTDTKAWFVESRWENRAYGAGLTPSWALWAGNELELGLSAKREAHTEEEIRPKAAEVNTEWSLPSRFSSQTFNLALEDTQQLKALRIVLGGGLSGLDLLSEAHRDKDYPVSDRTLRAFDGRLFADYTFTHLRLLAAAGHKTRYPTLKELFSNSIGGNPELEAERAWMYELGAEVDLRGFGLSGRIFYNQVTDLIDRAESVYANVAEATLAGAELGLETPEAPARLRLAYTHLYSHDARADRPLDRRTPHTLSAHARLRYGQTHLRLNSLLRVGQRSIFYDSGAFAWRDDEIPPSVLLGARLQHALLDGRLYAYLDGRNLLDDDYQTGSFAPQPGRRLAAGLGGKL